MQTRRELLLSGLALPFLGARPCDGKTRIAAEDHCLAEESARGYQRLLRAHPSSGRSFTIVPAVRNLPRATAFLLVEQARAGQWIVLETASFLADSSEQTRHFGVLKQFFGLNLKNPHTLPVREWTGEYIQYTWPLVRSTRTFLAVTPVQANSGETIAEWRGLPVAVRKPIGAGGVVVLGSLLGPNLATGDREAHDIGSGLLSRLRRAI